MKPAEHAFRQVRLLKKVRQIAENAVPGILAEKVIDDLEAGNIKRHQLKAFVKIGIEQLLDALAESGLVEKSGKAIIRNLIHQSVAGFLKRRDVEENSMVNVFIVMEKRMSAVFNDVQ